MMFDNLFVPKVGSEVPYRNRNRNFPTRTYPQRNHREYGQNLKNKFLNA